eukprot:TRINITY_DN25829_c0_g1_i2.p2 TRINITY_DN25829_c0_g1~~TRINITY_DN25829_c0_g1_i2.p2  ORF type:complete len:431 (+),score=147.09 TRINITY_DN25829_c0_g1_i2:51-1295(+)
MTDAMDVPAAVEESEGTDEWGTASPRSFSEPSSSSPPPPPRHSIHGGRKSLVAELQVLTDAPMEETLPIGATSPGCEDDSESAAASAAESETATPAPAAGDDGPAICVCPSADAALAESGSGARQRVNSTPSAAPLTDLHSDAARLAALSGNVAVLRQSVSPEYTIGAKFFGTVRSRVRERSRTWSPRAGPQDAPSSKSVSPNVDVVTIPSDLSMRDSRRLDAVADIDDVSEPRTPMSASERRQRVQTLRDELERQIHAGRQHKHSMRMQQHFLVRAGRLGGARLLPANTAPALPRLPQTPKLGEAPAAEVESWLALPPAATGAEIDRAVLACRRGSGKHPCPLLPELVHHRGAPSAAALHSPRAAAGSGAAAAATATCVTSRKGVARVKEKALRQAMAHLLRSGRRPRFPWSQ